MEEAACLVIYHPNTDPEHSVLSVPPILAGIKTQRLLANGRALAVTFDPQSDFPARVRSSLASSAADVYVSQPLSRNRSACLLRVEGMVCTSCSQLIETTISKEEGVHGVKVSLSNKEAMVEFDPALKNAQTIASAIDNMGFDAESIFTHPVSSLLIPPSPTPRGSSDEGATDEKSVVLGIEGMVCQSCVSNIQTNISTLGGIKGVVVSLADKNANITYDSTVLSVEELCAAIEDLGFIAKCGNEEVAVVEAHFAGEGVEVERVRRCLVGIEGMTCHSCVSLVESVVQDIGGVVKVTVTLETKEGVIEYDAGQVGEEEIRSAIEDTGFEVTSICG